MTRWPGMCRAMMAYLQRGHADGTFLLSGQTVPPTGGGCALPDATAAP
ncbi:hypothetical protein [Nonomuraea longispora]|nr:hypothetical protein [Nonomuraea longispora]